MKIFFYTFMISALLVASACDDNPVRSGPAKPIMPMQSGNRWFGTAYLMVDDSVLEDYSYTLGVCIDTVIEDENWYGFRWIRDSISRRDHNFYTNRRHGLWIWPAFHDTTWGEPNLYLKYPARVGDSCRTDFSPITIIKVLATDTLIEVPYGEMKTVCYRIIVTELNGYYYENRHYIPGIGLIYLEAHGAWMADTVYYWHLDSVNFI